MNDLTIFTQKCKIAKFFMNHLHVLVQYEQFLENPQNNGNMQEKVYNNQQEFLIPVVNYKPILTLLPMINRGKYKLLYHHKSSILGNKYLYSW